MSHDSANQHSTQTTIKPIVFVQNRISFLQIQGRGKKCQKEKKGAITLPERTYGKKTSK
jgi:hypothetical protein